MHVQFGLHLDGLDPVPPRTAIGEIAVGPLGLIRILETDLGLAPVHGHPARRLIAYRGCLAAADGPGRFFHRSFRVDPIGVARTLGAWREQWYEAGWDGTAPEGASTRIRDMAAVEAFAAGVAFGPGQRVQRILRALERCRTQIVRLTLREDPEALPLVWRRLVERLGFELADGVTAAGRAPAGTDLHRLQALLLESNDRARGSSAPAPTPERIPLAADGSLVVVRAASRDISARAIAEMLLRSGRPSETVLIAEQDGIILDNAMERSGLPRCGFQHYSSFRAVSQVLKLALTLLWEPQSPRLLLQFLIHPLGPVDVRIRRALAEAIAESPGVGGRAWQDAVTRLGSEFGETVAQQDLAEIVRYWFEGERFRPADGVPVPVLCERAQRCATWLGQRLAGTGDAGERILFANALAQAEALIAALSQLAEQGRERIRKIELERLVDEVGREQPDPAQFTEAGAARATIDPGSVTGPWREVVWWDLKARSRSLDYPWTRAELLELRGIGVALPSVEARLEARARSWLRPLLNCNERLILVVHHGEEGNHPLWTRIESRVRGFAEVDLEAVLLDGERATIPYLAVDTRPLAVRPLPAPQRWWRLPVGTAIAGRPVESYSSLSKLYFYTHEYVLGYAAALRPGRAEDLADGPLLYGNLGHRLFEAFFEAHADWRTQDAAAIERWLGAALPDLIAKEGAVLLEPGRGVDRERVTTTLERALERLVDTLRESDVVKVAAEQRERAPFGVDGVELQGVIDLLLTRKNGEEVVVDAKWGGERQRAEEIETNLHLQLASYAYLRKRAPGANRWPYQAYFIITTGNMLAPDDRVFPNAVVREPEPGADAETLWRRAEATYRWRRGQLDAGRIEVNAASAEPTPESAPPPDALETRITADRFDAFTRLTGWDEFS